MSGEAETWTCPVCGDVWDPKKNQTLMQFLLVHEHAWEDVQGPVPGDGTYSDSGPMPPTVWP